LKQKNSLLKTVYANESNLLEQVKAQIAAGADPNERTEYFETPLRVSSNNGRFDVVKCLFEAGADPTHLNWTTLFHAIAYGTLSDVKKCIHEGSDLHARDTWERTPVLLAVQTGDIEKVNYLIHIGADITDLGRCDKTALEYALQMDDARMLTFLVGLGFDFEDYNHFGYTALMQAADDGAINCVRCLLEHGADIYKKDRSQFSQKTAIAHASTQEIAEMLANAGDDINQMENEVRAQLLELGHQEKLIITKQDYLAQKHRVYGNSNPQKCEIAFFYDMVRCNGAAWKARSQFDDIDSFNDQPVWCYERYGKSITAIGNGEYIEIAGEHEDYYDPDFCIYNEVFHHKGGGDFTIYQYPESVFPPTDFHTATLVDKYIYIIGNLGYQQQRLYETTPVYRLAIDSFKIEKLETSGEYPGWIHAHSAELKNQSVIRIQGGEIVERINDKEDYIFNKYDFELDLDTLKWTKHEHVPKSGKPQFFPEEYKRFSYSDGSLVAVEENNKWRILKVISVHRIDITEGQNIQFENETLTVSSDDFLFVVAYSTSEPFDSFEFLEQAVARKCWNIESQCKVCRTINFPDYGRFLGFAESNPEERKSFQTWKDAFNEAKASII
jgi:ankyrin repeat protein